MCVCVCEVSGNFEDVFVLETYRVMSLKSRGGAKTEKSVEPKNAKSDSKADNANIKYGYADGGWVPELTKFSDAFPVRTTQQPSYCMHTRSVFDSFVIRLTLSHCLELSASFYTAQTTLS